MDISIFVDKSIQPDESMLKNALGKTYPLWEQICEFVYTKYPAIPDWNYPGAKYGWSFRLKDKKRAIIYLLPREGFFMAAFVFGEKALASVLASDIPEFIKTELSAARKYAEGRGIRIDVKNGDIIPAIQELVVIKLKH